MVHTTSRSPEAIHAFPGRWNEFDPGKVVGAQPLPRQDRRHDREWRVENFDPGKVVRPDPVPPSEPATGTTGDPAGAGMGSGAPPSKPPERDGYRLNAPPETLTEHRPRRTGLPEGAHASLLRAVQARAMSDAAHQLAIPCREAMRIAQLEAELREFKRATQLLLAAASFLRPDADRNGETENPLRWLVKEQRPGHRQDDAAHSAGGQAP